MVVLLVAEAAMAVPLAVVEVKLLLMFKERLIKSFL